MSEEQSQDSRSICVTPAGTRIPILQMKKLSPERSVTFPSHRSLRWWCSDSHPGLPVPQALRLPETWGWKDAALSPGLEITWLAGTLTALPPLGT